MSQSGGISSSPSVFAVAHRVGNEIAALAVETSREGPAKVIGSRHFTADRLGRLESWLDEHRVSRVIGVLPAASIISRTCTLPDVAPDQLDQALSLQAEAHLMGIAPPHRMGMAVIDQAAGETSRSGLVIAWPDKRSAPDLPTNRPITWAADLVALAAIINGDRPSEPLVWVDHADQSIALALSHANGVAFRATRDDAADDGDLGDSVARVLAETALNASHTGAFVETMVGETRATFAGREHNQSTLLIPRDLMDRAAARLDGAGDDEKWWNTFGIAAGIVIAATGPLADLTTLEDSRPEVKPSTVERMATAASRWSRASLLILAAIVLLIIGPLVVHAGRYYILSARYPDIDQQSRRAELVSNHREMYDYLKDNSWSMTKVLSDVACCTPRGIDIGMIRVNSQDRSFSISGHALPHDGQDSPEVVNSMLKNLNSTGIFKDVALGGGNPDYMGKYEFDLTAKVTQPYQDGRYPVELDFGRYTLLDRLMGKSPEDVDGAEPVETAVAAAEQDTTTDTTPATAQPTQPEPTDGPDPTAMTDASNDDARSDTRTRPGGTVFGSGGSADGVLDAGNQGDRINASTAGPSFTIPEAVSQAQIDAMTKAEVQAHLGQVANARAKIRTMNVDDATRERLDNEFQMLMARLRAERENANK